MLESLGHRLKDGLENKAVKGHSEDNRCRGERINRSPEFVGMEIRTAKRMIASRT